MIQLVALYVLNRQNLNKIKLYSKIQLTMNVYLKDGKETILLGLLVEVVVVYWFGRVVLLSLVQ